MSKGLMTVAAIRHAHALLPALDMYHGRDTSGSRLVCMDMPTDLAACVVSQAAVPSEHSRDAGRTAARGRPGRAATPASARPYILTGVFVSRHILCDFAPC